MLLKPIYAENAIELQSINDTVLLSRPVNLILGGVSLERSVRPSCLTTTKAVRCATWCVERLTPDFCLPL